MTIELPEELEAALKVQAIARGMSPDVYVREILERDLVEGQGPLAVPSKKNSYGILAKHGPAPNAREIDDNRSDIFRDSIFARDAQ